MKLENNIIGILIFACAFWGPENVLAQAHEEHFPVHTVLESSLMGLRESADNIAQRNAYLVGEIQNLRIKINNLQEETKAMVSMKDQIASRVGDSDPVAQARQQKTKLSQLSLDRLTTELNDLSFANAAIEQKMSIQKQAQGDIVAQIAVVEKNINELNDRRAQIDWDMAQSPEEIEKQDLLKSLQKTGEDLKRVEKDLQNYSHRVAKPQEVLASLKERNKDLKEQIVLLANSQQALSKEEKELAGEMLRLEKDFQKNSIRVAEQIKELEKRQKSAQELLTEAQTKLEGKDLELAYNEQVENQLKQDLTLIRQENRTLKQESVLLEQTLERLETEE